MTVIANCLDCKHFIDDGSFSCMAFDSIPDEILLNEVEHNEPVKDQHGKYIFEAREK